MGDEEKEERDQVNVRMSRTNKKKIQALVDQGEYANISSFVNEAIREKLDPNINKVRFTRDLLRAIKEEPVVRKEIFEVARP